MGGGEYKMQAVVERRYCELLRAATWIELLLFQRGWWVVGGGKEGTFSFFSIQNASAKFNTKKKKRFTETRKKTDQWRFITTKLNALREQTCQLILS